MIRPLPENRLLGKQMWARTSVEATSMPDVVVRTILPGSADPRLPKEICLGNLPMLCRNSSGTKLTLARSTKVVVRGMTAMMMVTRLCKGTDT